MRKILFSRESECVRPIKELVEKQEHKTLVVWALECSLRFLEIFEMEYPHDMRPRESIDRAWEWARGEIKMPIAKRAIHAAHNAAADAECTPIAQAAARAVAHAAATVHVETHALGVVLYGLTAIYYNSKPEEADAAVDKECEWFCERLCYWEDNAGRLETTWAQFLLKDTPNKEKLLRKK